MKKIFLILFCSSLLSPLSVLAEGKISGMVFGDFFWNAKNSNNALEGNTGFWIRRGYLTYDHTFDEDFSGRFRLEINSPDLTQASSNTTPYVKEANLQWKPNAHALQIGMVTTPTWVGIVEDHWGYRSVERTPLDLQRFGTAVDLGLGTKGTFGEEERYGYHLVVGNGSGTRSEANTTADKKFYGAFFVKPVKALVLQTYADVEVGDGNGDRYTFYGFSGYTKENWRTGLLFAYRVQRIAGPDQKFEILSGYGALKIADKFWTFARADHLFDPNPDGNNIQYLPLNTTADPTLILAGLDYEPVKDIHLIPNIESVVYETVNGVRPGSELITKMTFYWKF